VVPASFSYLDRRINYMPMVTTATSRFKIRGFAGIVLIALGIGLALVFKRTSDWPAEARTLALAVAYCAGIGGAAFFASYTQQLEYKQMKPALTGMAALLAMMLLLKL
jgi:putative hemolysin